MICNAENFSFRRIKHDSFVSTIMSDAGGNTTVSGPGDPDGKS